MVDGKIILIAPVVFFSISFLFFQEKTSTSVNGINLDGYSVIKKENALETKIIAEKNDSFFRLTKINDIKKVGAEKFSADKIYLVKSLYANYVSSYPGRLSYNVTCPKQFKPDVCEIPGSFNDLCLVAVTSERFVYGVCSSEIAKNTCLITFFFCEARNNLFQVEICQPIEKFNVEESRNMLKTFSCT